MTTLYPAALDTFENPAGDKSQNTSRTHSQQHGDSNDAIEAIEASLGITGSMDTASIRYMLNNGTFPYKYPAATTVQRTQAQRNADSLSLKDFGAVMDGTTDDSAAWQKALDYSDEFGPVVRIPSGFSRMAAGVSRVMSGYGCSLIGDGADGTTILFEGAGNCIEVSCPSNYTPTGNTTAKGTFRGLTFICNSASADTALALYLDDDAPTGGGGLEAWDRKIEDIRCEYGTAAWQTGVDCKNPTGLYVNRLVGVSVGQVGTLLKISGDGTLYPSNLFINNIFGVRLERLVDVSGNTEGIFAVNLSSVSGNHGIRWTSTTQPRPMLHLVNGHFHGIGAGVDLDGVSQSSLSNVLCYLSANGAVGIRLIATVTTASSTLLNSCSIFGVGGATGRTGIIVQNQNNVSIGGNGILNNLAIGLSLTGTNIDVTLQPSVRFNTVTTRVSGTSGFTEYNNIIAFSIVPTLTGGAATETLNIDITGLMLTGKPSAAFLKEDSGTPQALNCRYDFTNSTQTNARFILSRHDGANITAGATRFSFLCAPNLLR